MGFQMMKIFYYEIESIQIGRVFKVIVSISTKKTIEIKSKKPIGLKKRIYWLNGTKDDK